MSGEGRRRCIRAKTTNPAGPAAGRRRDHRGHPSSGPWTSGNTTAAEAALTSSTLGTSSRSPASGVPRGTQRTAPARARRPSGRLTRNTRRQPEPNRSAPASSPPTTGLADGAQAHDRPEQTEGLGKFGFGEGLLDDAEALRQQQGPEGALDGPGGDQRAGVGGEGAQGGGGRETGGADQEEPPPPVPVPQPPGGDQQGGEGQRVAGLQPLGHGLAAAEVGGDDGGGDAGDGGVQKVHHFREEDDAEDRPAARVRVRVRVRKRVVCVGQGRSPRSVESAAMNAGHSRTNVVRHEQRSQRTAFAVNC